MLDNIRDQASFTEEEEQPDLNPPKPAKPAKPPKVRKPRRSFDQITGMTAGQRLALAVMLSVIVCLLGTMLLIVLGKIVPPFMQ
jgi:hypothetical protein